MPILPSESFPFESICYCNLVIEKEHRHSYVRKNAIFAIWQIYKTSESLIPDAPELIQTFIAAETDTTCKRNGFVALINLAPSRAIEYFLQIYETIGSLDELMQLSIIELVRADLKESNGKLHRNLDTLEPFSNF